MPLNPEFIEYQEQLSSGNLTTGNRTHGLGYIPSPVRQSGVKADNIMRASLQQLEGYPSVYDLRSLLKVTPVKDQGSAGTCWAFATYASMESFLMPSEIRDFSENNLKNRAGFDLNVNNGGGNIDMSTAYLTRWDGPVNEADDPYNPYTVTSPSGLAVQKHVQDVLYLPSYYGPSDLGNIKSAIMSYGAVYARMEWGDAYYNPVYRSYYYSSGSTAGGHAVTIVGWNDNYDRNWFNSPPPGNGAFIVKNSWGTGWGENGYFYVSYYDRAIADVSAVFMAEPASNYDNIYQYDPLGWTYNIGIYSDVAWFANVFAARSNETLRAVGFYVPEEGDNCDIYVFNETGLVATKLGIINPPMGYHTFVLDTPVPIKSGERFSVEVKVDCPGWLYSYVCAEMPQWGYSSKATANASESFISFDGESWDDITTGFPGTSLCLKAYTSDPQSLQFSPTSYNVNRNVGTVTLTITKSGSTGQSATVNYYTTDGTALAGNDYTAKSGQITFQPSDTTKTITIDIKDIPGYKDKSFYVNLSALVNATIGTNASATITIRNSHMPIQQIDYPVMSSNPDLNQKGGVSGRVTTSNNSIGIANTDVYIVNRNNTSQYYWHGTTNAQGFFQVIDVNNTWNDTVNGYLPQYKMYCFDSLLGEGCSNNFTVEVGSNAWAAIIIIPSPAHLTLSSGNGTIVANDSDNTTISAYVTDPLNNPVRDGFNVLFSLSDNSTGKGLFGPDNSSAPTGNSIIASTVNGYAKVRFGWATGTGINRINATWIDNPDINDTLVETILQSPPSLIGFGMGPCTVNENDGVVTITLLKKGYSSANASITYTTAGGNATAGTNYQVTSGTIVFRPAETVKTFTIQIVDDGVYDHQKLFYVSLSDPINAAIAGNNLPISINNVDNAPVIQFEAPSMSVYDNVSIVTINVTKTGNTKMNASVSYYTVNHTAEAGLDFVNASGSLTFAPGETKKNFTLTILLDVSYEDYELFDALLNNPDNATLNTYMKHTVCIISSVSHNVTINLTQGWNLISIPVNNVTLRASDLVGNVSLGVDMVAVYNKSISAFTIYYSGALPWKNMQLSPDIAYFVHGTKRSAFGVTGVSLPAHYTSITRGWNMVGWSCLAKVNASEVFNRISLSMIARYNNSIGIYQIYYPGALPVKNFTLTGGEGYFIYSDVPAVQQLYIG